MSNRKKSLVVGSMNLKVLEFVARELSRGAPAPAIREIAQAVRPAQPLSTSVVNYYLDDLEVRGLLVRARSIARGLALTEKGWTAVGFRRHQVLCPHCGAELDLGLMRAGEQLPIEVTAELKRQPARLPALAGA